MRSRPSTTAPSRSAAWKDSPPSPSRRGRSSPPGGSNPGSTPSSPRSKELDTPLLKDRPLPARDARLTHLPLDLLERIPPRDREQTTHANPRVLVDDDVSGLDGAGLGGLNLSRGRHALLLPEVRVAWISGTWQPRDDLGRRRKRCVSRVTKTRTPDGRRPLRTAGLTPKPVRAPCGQPLLTIVQRRSNVVWGLRGATLRFGGLSLSIFGQTSKRIGL